MKRIWYRDSVLDEEGEDCPENCIIRYYQDKDNWIDVIATASGIEVSTVNGQMVLRPMSGNLVEVYQKGR